MTKRRPFNVLFLVALAVLAMTASLVVSGVVSQGRGTDTGNHSRMADDWPFSPPSPAPVGGR